MILFANNHKNDMNLYNLPLFVIYPIALIGRFFPKTLLNLRYFAHHKKFINWDSPRNLHEYAQALLFSSTTDIDQYAMLADKLAVRDFVKERIGEGTSDEDISLIEDINDTYTDLETRVSEAGDWKAKYEENDASWRTKYKERFFDKPVEKDAEISDPLDKADEGTHEVLKFEDLFTEGE